MKRFLIAVLLTPWLVLADDHGNSPSAATFIPPGSTGLVANLETDYDVDWFRFIAAPTLVYTVRVSNVTIWDNELAIKAFAEGGTLYATNSIFIAAPGAATLVWTNTGGLRSYYIGISSMFEFTTGTYSVVISANDADLDGDGMADAWEIATMGSTTNGANGDLDGDDWLNYQEYVTGTHPSNSTSFFAITNLVRGGGTATIFWPAVPYGTYRVDASSDLRSPTNWLHIDRLYQSNLAGPLQKSQSMTNNWRHFRVVYEP